jgi:hypothetical protein
MRLVSVRSVVRSRIEARAPRRHPVSLVGPMDKATAYGAVDSGFESQAGLGPPFGGAPIKIGTIQRRLAWPLRKDDTHKSRWYRYFFTDTVAERLRRWTRNPLGFSRMSSNLIGVDASIAFCLLGWSSGMTLP